MGKANKAKSSPQSHGKNNSKTARGSAKKKGHDDDPQGEDNPNDNTPNRPRNFYVTDATQPFGYAFAGRFGLHHALTIHQTPAEETWPGGALWDLGVLLSHALLSCAGVSAAVTTTTIVGTTGTSLPKKKSKNHTIPPLLTLLGEQPNQKQQQNQKQQHSKRPASHGAANGDKNNNHNNSDWIHDILLSPQSVWLELGCGVGLTGLVAAAALRPALVVLTDLQVVIEHVTQRNVEENTVGKKGSSRNNNSKSASQQQFRLLGQTPCVAHPLCWGNDEDVTAVHELIHEFQQQQQQQQQNGKRKGKKKGQQNNHNNNNNTTSATTASTNNDDDIRRQGKPNVVLIGDVAYQHKPGAASHFDALHATLLQVIHDETVVIFGTRIRMAASHDILELFLQDLDQLAAVTADQLEPTLFANVKHNMTIHFLRKKQSP